MINELGSTIYNKFEAIVVPIFGGNTKGTPHYDATQAQRYASDMLGYGVVASAIYGLHAAGCSEESIFMIMTAFLDHADQRKWKISDDPR